VSAPEENKALVRRYCEAYSRGDDAAVADLLADGYVSHLRVPSDKAENRRRAAASRVSLRDQRLAVEDMVAEGDRVAWRWTLRAIHTGVLAGIAPTGREVAFGGLGVVRVEGGRIAEMWDLPDALGLLRLLGALPPSLGKEDAPR
jgi:predicted ester cyclase